GLNDANFHVAGEIDAVEAIVDLLAQSLVQLGRQLYARSPGTDDSHRQGLARRAVWLGLSAKADIQEALLQALGLLVVVEIEAVLLDSRDAEIIAGAADRDHQSVVAQAAARDDLAALGILD